MDDVLYSLYETVLSRRDDPREGSYTCYLLDAGLDKILKKLGEESSETIIAAKNGDPAEIVSEAADLLFHLTVLLVKSGVTMQSLTDELRRRSEKTGNLKQFRQTDKNS
ncbi:MAG: phosphoribosyl-ATP diphosphatase [Oscillospiraceae bacterium]|nr:phosphoribosyl-ATP diphosphatase [Oscillospiraceae bacterium]